MLQICDEQSYVTAPSVKRLNEPCRVELHSFRMLICKEIVYVCAYHFFLLSLSAQLSVFQIYKLMRLMPFIVIL